MKSDNLFATSYKSAPIQS